MAKKRVKTGATTSGITNGPLELFLLKLSVDAELRKRYSAATEDEKRQLLASEPFLIGDATIDALLREDPGAVRARFSLSDQQGIESVSHETRAKQKKPRAKSARRR